LRHHRIGVHPNKYVADHNRRKATEQTHKLTVAANKRLNELKGGARRFSRPASRRGSSRSRNVTRYGANRYELPYNFRVTA
jgi:hypothetical protein